MKTNTLCVVLCFLVTLVKPEMGTGGNGVGLPFWCDQKAREASGWKSDLRGGIYHYCAGLSSLNDYWTKRSAYEKNYALTKAIGEFNYMLANNKGSRSPMLGEIHMNKALALRLGGNDVEAIAELRNALEHNPRLLTVYLELATIYTKLKMNERALEVVSQGLRYLPNTKSLEQRYTALGGTLPFLAPITKQPEEIGTPSMKPAPSPQSLNPENKEPKIIRDEQNEVQEEGRKVWCRFCP